MPARLLVAAFFVFTLTCLTAAAQPDRFESGKRGQEGLEAERIVDEILELDGTKELLEHAFEEFKEHYKKSPLMSQKEYEKTVESARLGMGSFEYETAYKHAFMESFDPQSASATLDWLRTPTGGSMRRLEESVSGSRIVKVNSFLNSPEGHQQWLQRSTTLERYSSLRNCTQEAIERVVNSRLTKLAVTHRERPKKEQYTEADFRRMAEQFRREEVEFEGLANGCWWPLVYAFRNVTDQELESYVAFFETPAGQWYVKAENSARHAASLDAAIRVSEYAR